MAKDPRGWVHGPGKPRPPKVPDHLKGTVEQAATELIEKVLKPAHVKPPPAGTDWNYIADIYPKWHGSYFYFCAIYKSPRPDTIGSSFETRFARLEYRGGDRFALAYMRHTGQWIEIYDSLSLQECLESIEKDPWFQP